MNRILTTAGMAFLTLFSCCSKDSGNSTSTTSANSMTALVNGKAFSSSQVSLGGDSTYLSIYGLGSNAYIEVYIDHYTGIGTYPVGTNWNVPTEYSVNNNVVYAAYGTVTIAATSPKVIGTFSFTCQDSTKITNGAFSAK